MDQFVGTVATADEVAVNDTHGAVAGVRGGIGATAGAVAGVVTGTTEEFVGRALVYVNLLVNTPTEPTIVCIF